MYFIAKKKELIYDNDAIHLMFLFATDFIPEDAQYPELNEDEIQLLLNEYNSLRLHLIPQKLFEHFKKVWRSLVQVSFITNAGDMYSFKFDEKEKIIHK